LKCPPQTKKELLSNLILFYIGRERSAGSILSEQKASMGKNSSPMSELTAISREMKNVLEQGGELARFGDLLDRSWQIKRRLSDKISDPVIDGAYEKAMKSGARGGKLLGAGGGGFLLFFVEDPKKDGVRKSLAALREIPFAMDPEGSKIVYREP
jgi:D-glycero-alpha-D-manno-heptose-7-phosphate kinase